MASIEADAGVEGRSRVARILFGFTFFGGLALVVAGCGGAFWLAWMGSWLLAAGMAVLGVFGVLCLPMGMLAFYRGGSRLDPETRELETWWRLGPLGREKQTQLGELQISVQDVGSVRYPRHTVFLTAGTAHPFGSFTSLEDAERAAAELRNQLG